MNINLVKQFWNHFSAQEWDASTKLLHQDFVAI